LRAVVLVLVAARLRAFDSDDQVEATVVASAGNDGTILILKTIAKISKYG
jgi:hypothetical protein